jgi:hypothetical protein
VDACAVPSQLSLPSAVYWAVVVPVWEPTPSGASLNLFRIGRCISAPLETVALNRSAPDEQYTCERQAEQEFTDGKAAVGQCGHEASDESTRSYERRGYKPYLPVVLGLPPSDANDKVPPPRGAGPP